MDDKTPANFYLGGGASETVMGSAGAVLLVIACICIFCFPKKYVIVPALMAMFLIPMGQVLVLGGFHLSPSRVVALAGWIRILCMRVNSPKGASGYIWNSIDSAFAWCEVCSAGAFILLWMQTAAVTNQAGVLWGSLGVYFMLRSLIVDQEDVRRAFKTLIVVVVINALAMTYEQMTLRNLFGVYVGGVSSVPAIRDGKTRSQGAFSHAILAGTFAATLVAPILGLWQKGKSKIPVFAGIAAAATMVYTCASSTPAIALVAGIIGACLWSIRSRMRTVRWSIVGALVVAQLLMKAPVWFLIAHMDLLGASSGYHRAELVDVFIRHFFDWWLVGTRDAGTWGWEMFDASNQFVARGEGGGLLGFIFFIVMISRSFAAAGKTRIASEGRRAEEWMAWCLGVGLFAHIVAFFGISYWDQTQVAWYTLLACICAGTRRNVSVVVKAQNTGVEEVPAWSVSRMPATETSWGVPD